MRALPQAARRYLVGLWCTALLFALGASLVYPSRPIQLIDILSALIFAGMLMVGDLTSFEIEDDRAISITMALLIAGVTAINWPLMFGVVIVGTASAALARDISWWQMASIIAVRTISVVIASEIALLHLSDGFFEPGVGNLPYTTLTALIALLLTGAILYAVERIAEGGLAIFAEGKPLRQAMRFRNDEVRWHVLMLAPLGGLLATLWEINGFAFMLGIVPVVVLQNAFRSQGELLRYSTAVQNLAADSSALSNKLERLQGLMVALISTRDVPAMLELLCDRLAVLMSASNGWVVLLDDLQQPVMVAAYNLPIPVDGSGPFPVPFPKSYETVLGRQRVMMFTDQHTQTLAPLPELTQNIYWNALVCIPLVEEKRVMGAICLTFPEIRGLSEDEQRVLMTFARQAATVIQNARLFRKVQESQAELIQSSKLAAVGTFAAGIAHEFNNLLAGMLGYAQLGLASPDDETKNESLKVVVDTCKRGKSITGSLLTFGRRQEPRRELADIYDAVQGTLTLMEIELRKHNIKVERKISPVPLTICDSGQISQVFLNFLTNARDAMKPAGGTLTVRLISDDQRITLAVSDTGCGIPDSIRDKIFEPFVTTKGALGGSATPGTGLGLSVSYGIVKSHGGAFEVDSEPGKGTTMTIHLPIVESAQEAAALAAAEQEPEDLPSLSLLVVDDDISISKSLQGLLEHIGHKVTIYADALSALDAYKTRGYDIVLSDLSMPGMNGIELLRELRAYDPEARVLIFTGQALPNLIEEAGRAGALSVLRKPFELEEVLKAIRSAYFHRRSTPITR
ncbi:response regulator [Oscillochloris sp. ZM17-4]|uniref:ATP-binding protein n=1 Tax=Oscillochloris sp. ZM17-4 TaxID=2866714 RepID=UPI001C72EAC2|nr:ATP-binding protein [Oscillochloris sp. ZM17-4]MBX0330334.1 response regulator [Oscillochloris sp. ZM17-4]